MATGRRKIGRPALAGIDCRGENGHPTHAYKLARQVEMWGDSFTPACACGCGEPVRFSERGPGKYVNRQHVYWGRDSATAAIRGKEALDVEVFRKACLKIKAEKGWSVQELADKGGLGRGHLSKYLYSYSNTQKMDKDIAVSFLRRCAGLPEKPSKRMMKLAKEKEMKLKRWERDNNRKGRSS